MPRTILLIATLALPALAQGITNGSFEELGANGQPVGWQTLGSAQVVEGGAFDGARALRLLRSAEEQGEVGLNRDWQPENGQQGSMLAEVKGGIRFRYKAVSQSASASLTVQIIPMNDRPLETGGKRVIWTVPPDAVGDGAWHEGAFAYDFSSESGVRWVHVAARLTGGAGELWLDGFEWVASLGPVVACDSPTLEETVGREGTEARLTAKVRNLGDAPLPAATVDLELPQGLSGAPASVAVEPLGPGAFATVRFTVSGRREREGDEIRIRATAGDQRAATRLVLAPDVQPAGLRCSRLLAKPGESVTLELLVENRGTAFAPPQGGTLLAPDVVEAQLDEVRAPVAPGTKGPFARWRVSVGTKAPFVRLRAKLDGGPTSETYLVVADGAPSEAPATAAECALFSGGPSAWAAVRKDGEMLLGSDKLRLALHEITGHRYLGALQTASGTGWKTVALLPWMALLATPEGEFPVPASGTAVLGSEDGASLRVTGALDAGGVHWRAQWVYSVAPGGRAIRSRVELRPDRDAQILAFEGPTLYAEGADREDALLPGLEWLVKGEESSNALDITPAHPDRLRVVPHPRKVTVPFASARLGDTAVALLWDTPSTESASRPPFAADLGPANVVFASPDRFEGHAGHLMGLILPAVGSGMVENERRASEPVAVPSGRALALSGELYAEPGATDCLGAMDYWFATRGVPEPPAYPRGSALAEVEFSLRGYGTDRALWIPESRRWFSDLIVNPAPTDGPALDLLRGAVLLAPSPASEAARALAADALGGDGSARLEHRANPDELRGRARQARGLLASQSEDGSWRFGGEKAGDWPVSGANYEVLGPVGASEVGLTAPNAATLLEFALLTGDPEARAGGLRALEAIRRFRVPRAAQVWEVPVHTPDILASARGVDANLAGYKLTGDERWLEEAVYWARTGLPFVYVWAAEDTPEMLGASIPVFGATAYVLSWFGVAVQWNGVAYAESLSDLARYDASFPWDTVAESLYRSAMWQQATEGERLAQWPDAVNLIPGRAGLHGQTPPCFQPASILRRLYQTLGLHPSPSTVAARKGAETVAIRAQATLTDASWSDDALSFTVAWGTGERGSVEVLGIDRPARVAVDGADLPEGIDSGTGWRWLEEVSDLEIVLSDGGTHAVSVEGVAKLIPDLAPPLRTSADFDFATCGIDGWVAAHDAGPLSIEEGALATMTTGSDPYLTRDSLAVAGRAGDVLVLRLSLSGGATLGGIFWGTARDPGFAPAREMPWECPADGSAREVRIPVGEHPQWAGQSIASLRLDPPGPGGVAVRIEGVRLVRKGD